MLFRSSYLAYKRETSRLVFLLVTATNAIRSVKKGTGKLNTSGKLDSTGIIPSAELIVKHMKSIPCEILRLLKSVIKLRTSHYAEFQRRVCANPNFEMEESNKSHKHFIDVLYQAFNILGGEGRLHEDGAKAVEADEAELSNEDFQATCSNMFSHLQIYDLADSDEGDDEVSTRDAGQTTSRTGNARKALAKRKKSKSGKASKDKNCKRLDKLSIDQYGILDDDHHVAAEYFLAASLLVEQSIELRLRSLLAWRDVAYREMQPLLALATSGQSIAMVRRSHATICSDFAGSHSYMDLINTYTRGGVQNLQRKTTIRLSGAAASEDSCVSMNEVEVPLKSMKELLMTHAYNNLVEFVRDFRKTSSGVPTKRMQDTISRWDLNYDLVSATPGQRRGWRRVYTINWLYALVGYYMSSKKLVDHHAAHTPYLSTAWAEEYAFFGLGQFARSIISLVRQPAESPIEGHIPPHLVFQLQCIVDSFTALRGFIVDPWGQTVKAPPVVVFSPSEWGVVGYYNRLTCGNKCEHHQGLARSFEVLEDLSRSCQTRPGAFGKDKLSLVWASWRAQHRVMVNLRNGKSPRFRPDRANGHMDEYGLFSLSPFLCGSAILQTVELFFRYAMYVWDTTPEIILILHLHNMLHQKGLLKEPVQMMEKVTSLFMADLFGETPPASDFYQAFVHRKEASQLAVSPPIQPLLINTPSFQQFHMSERFFKTRSSFLVFHEADWDAAAVSPLRTASLSEDAYLRDTIRSLTNRSSYDSRKRIAKSCKSGDKIELPHFDPDSNHIHEKTVLDFGEMSLHQDLCSCCPTPLSGINFLAVTAKMWSVWIALAEKLKRSGHVSSSSDGADSTTSSASDSAQDAVERVVAEALRGEDEGLLNLLAEVFDEIPNEDIQSFAYFSKGSRSRGGSEASED
ncbi:hypothetical protein E4U41_000918 [Claviceps citrina]|nr:hypothetical protein E4U41_000918 [Claviceps citrina]